MARLLRCGSHIVVVDARPRDYRDLVPLAGKHGWHLHFLTSGLAAVRFVRGSGVDLWMISVTLPEMSGFDLLEMLRDQVASANVFLVADRYDAEQERRACCCGASLYLCKGADRSIDCERIVDLLVDDSLQSTSAAAQPQHKR